MKVNHAELVISAVKPEQYPKEGLPEFALAGRSNVGKSSFINKMINRRSLARTSSKPGKTQTLNFYNIEEKLYFVDVPGYGFAKVSKRDRDAWGEMIETYFMIREQLNVVLLIVDLRHPPTKDDVMMYDFLKHYGFPCIVIATKADKVPKGKRQRQLQKAKDTLNLEKEDEIILFSSETGEGKDQTWNALKKWIK